MHSSEGSKRGCAKKDRGLGEEEIKMVEKVLDFGKKLLEKFKEWWNKFQPKQKTLIIGVPQKGRRTGFRVRRVSVPAYRQKYAQ